MFKNLKKRAEGFTIIEVMIVLVIAAVILLIVFLAVPALQRNSRNTQRKNDVAGVLSAVNEWSNNNGGAYPANSLQQIAALMNAKTGFYKSGNITFANAGTANLGDTEKAQVETDAGCVDATPGTAVAKTRSVVILYTVESGNGPVNLCLGS